MEKNRIGIGKERMGALIKRKLSWGDVRELIVSRPGPERFWVYVQTLQDMVPWVDKILLPIHENLFIVKKPDGQRIVKCECGHEFGDYRYNWKLSCDIYVRRTKEEFEEVYQPAELGPDPEINEIREYYCPGCQRQLSVEVCPPGFMPVFEFLPDLDTFYREWLGEPLGDENPEWYQSKVSEVTARWSSTKNDR